VSGLPWFRMYAEAIDDDKLRLLSFDDRWHFFALLCLKAMGVLDERNEELRRQRMSIKMGLDSVELETVMKRLVTVGLVSTRWQPINWNKRQFRSDSSTSRVRAFRERSRNVAVTPQSQSRADPETEHKVERASPRARRCPEGIQLDTDFALKAIPDLDVATEAAKFRDWEFKDPKSDWKATWRTWIRRCKETGRYAKAGPKWQ
jgi:hypothetical protein